VQVNIGIRQVAQAKALKRNRLKHHFILIIPSLSLPDLLHIFSGHKYFNPILSISPRTFVFDVLSFSFKGPPATNHTHFLFFFLLTSICFYSPSCTSLTISYYGILDGRHKQRFLLPPTLPSMANQHHTTLYFNFFFFFHFSSFMIFF
jgi:hypothetical protein